MSGIVTFQFDDGHLSHYTEAFPTFQKYHLCGCLALLADPARGMGFEKALEMQGSGWEVLCHGKKHIRMNEPLPPKTVREELIESKAILEAAGFHIRQFVTPMSQYHVSMRETLAAEYDAAFTRYTNSRTEPVETLAIEKPVNRYDLHRACLSGKTPEELRAYVDRVVREDAWLVFYDHDLGKGENITAEGLDALLAYCKERGAAVLTSSEALDMQKCRVKILREGYDGRECFVHARIASDGGEKRLITAQKMDVRGSDCFELLQVNASTDGGKTWTGFAPDEAFSSTFTETMRAVCCDMTPFYHKKTGKFLATGHIAEYHIGSLFPVDPHENRRVTPYAVYDEKSGKFGAVKHLKMPEGVTYQDCGSGCSQIFELPDGDLLVPISYRVEEADGKLDAKASVLRCAFDGETLTLREIGNRLEVRDEVRGIGECSVIGFEGKFYLTVRGDTHGYFCSSEDGLNFTQPAVWKWQDGEVIPTYNTQSHWFVCGNSLYLVYTRKNGKNDHVFRHRAPLYAAKVDTETMTLIRESEFVVVPERGARLGNFGVCQDGGKALVLVSEWMQPVGCEQYGSDNAVWLADVTV